MACCACLDGQFFTHTQLLLAGPRHTAHRTQDTRRWSTRHRHWGAGLALKLAFFAHIRQKCKAKSSQETGPKPHLRPKSKTKSKRFICLVWHQLHHHHQQRGRRGHPMDSSLNSPCPCARWHNVAQPGHGHPWTWSPDS